MFLSFCSLSSTDATFRHDLLELYHCYQRHGLLLKINQQTFGGRAPPGPAGELKRSPRSPAVAASRPRTGGRIPTSNFTITPLHIMATNKNNFSPQKYSQTHVQKSGESNICLLYTSPSP